MSSTRAMKGLSERKGEIQMLSMPTPLAKENGEVLTT